MRIGICGPFNPQSVSSYIDDPQSIPDINNTATAVNIFVEELLQQGHDVIVFTVVNDSQYYHISGQNINIYLIPNKPPFISKGHIFSFLYLPKRIANKIREHLPELDVLHAQWTYEPALAASFFAKEIPVFCTVRDWCPYILSLQRSFRNRITWYARLLIFRKLMKSSDVHFIANSKYTYSRIKNDYSDKEIQIIPNPFKKELILDTKINNDIRHQFVSISQSIEDPRKNIEIMLLAFQHYRKSYPESQLHLIGSYSEKSNKYRNWKNAGLLHGVCLHGRISHDKVFTILDSASCLIHPSLEETFGNILIESMSRCVPCIGGEESGAIPQVLGYGKYGLVCNVKDYRSILKAMLTMNDANIYSNIQNQATMMLRLNYSSDVIVKKHIDLYNHICNDMSL